MPAMSIEFAGFQPSLIAFLEELETHNNRTWFAANKPRYETDVLAPALAFIDAMAPHMLAVSPHFPTLAKRVGGSLMRVYRDTRFARDKRPYKTNVGIQFRHRPGKDVPAPGVYVHIPPESNFLGPASGRPWVWRLSCWLVPACGSSVGKKTAPPKKTPDPDSKTDLRTVTVVITCPAWCGAFA